MIGLLYFASSETSFTTEWCTIFLLLLTFILIDRQDQNLLEMRCGLRFERDPKLCEAGYIQLLEIFDTDRFWLLFAPDAARYAGLSRISPGVDTHVTLHPPS